MKKSVFNIGQKQSADKKDNLSAMIEDSLSYSNNKLNISFDEKDQSMDQEESLEKDVSSFLNQLNQPSESGIFQQLSKVMDSDFVIQESVQNEDYDNDQFLKEISDELLDKLTNKSLLYQPLIELKNQYEMFLNN